MRNICVMDMIKELIRILVFMMLGVIKMIAVLGQMMEMGVNGDERMSTDIL